MRSEVVEHDGVAGPERGGQRVADGGADTFAVGGPVEQGERQRFSFDERRITQIALTADLVALGVQPRRATLCAVAFTDAAEGQGAHPAFPQRLPDELFQGAYTFLVVPPGEASAKVLPVTYETTVIELMHPEYGEPFHTPS